MKSKIYLVLITLITTNSLTAQGVKGLFDKITKKDSTGKSVLDKVTKTVTPARGILSNEEIISGLKEALRVGTDSSAQRLGKLDGFFADAAVKILMPEEGRKAEKTLRNLGMGKLVDKAILSMNRAAEDAAKGVGNIFWNSIKQMSNSDGLQILRGGDFAATDRKSVV